MNHATVRIGEYTIPLIGVPESATQSKCERCKTITHIADLKLADGRFLCAKCSEEPK